MIITGFFAFRPVKSKWWNSLWSDEAGGMTVQPGDVEIMIGKSSGEILLTETFTIT